MLSPKLACRESRVVTCKKPLASDYRSYTILGNQNVGSVLDIRSLLSSLSLSLPSVDRMVYV
jgi:hypothetical protein